MSCAFDLAVSDGQTVIAWLTGVGGPTTVYEDAAATIPAKSVSASAYPGTSTSRRFYVASPGTYTLTAEQDGEVIATQTVVLSTAAAVVCGPFSPVPPLSLTVDGGTP